ncbi:CASP-like protein, partial [Fagus crenata]
AETAVGHTTMKNCEGPKKTQSDPLIKGHTPVHRLTSLQSTTLPFAMHYACTEKRLIRDGCLPEFDFYGDKIISLLLATGVGAGFAISCELNRFFHARFFDKGNIAAGFLLGATVCMAVVSVLSSIDRSTSRGFFR